MGIRESITARQKTVSEITGFIVTTEDQKEMALEAQRRALLTLVLIARSFMQKMLIRSHFRACLLS